MDNILIELVHVVSDPVITASLAGSMLYSLVQHSFNGVSRLLSFIVSFIMGVAGSGMTTDIILKYLPTNHHVDKSIGAFICSATVVTLTMRIISYSESFSLKIKEG